MKPVVIDSITSGFTNCFIIKQDGIVLIDTGIKGKITGFTRAIAGLDIEYKDIDLIIHTHGHYDHIGNTLYLKELTKAKTAIHRNGRDCLEKGKVLIPPGVTAWGRFLGYISKFTKNRIRIDECKVDIVIDDAGLDLTDFGIEGKIIYSPGHSFGSVAILLRSGELFAGDMAMNGFPFRKGAGLPVFAEDIELLKKSWKKLINMGAKTVFPAHGKPFPVENIKKQLM